MKNLKKLGVSALAGSLVAFTANAVELTVSGQTEITYSGTADGNNGNKWGNGNEISFTGSGDVNGMTATYFATIADNGQGSSNTSETFASSSLTLDMGDMGLIGMDNGVGLFGADTIDDKMPYAYEEANYGSGGSNGIRAKGGCNTLGYIGTFSGVKINAEINPGSSSSTTATKGCASDGANSGNGTGAAKTDVKGYNFAITSAPIDGLNVGTGYATASAGDDTGAPQHSEDNTFITAYATYAVGPVTIGYQKSEGNGGSKGTASNHVDLYGISFNVNENFAISVNQIDNDVNLPSTATVTEEMTGIGASYTMGSATLRLVNNETSNPGGVSTAKDVEFTEVSLALSF
jgi:outer membrane protein OmpU